jgi:aldehyde dehydrogenase (NAD+)
MIDLEKVMEKQLQFFRAGNTRSEGFRRTQLLALKKMIATHEEEILKAVYLDLHKPDFENKMSETQIVLWEIDHVLNNLAEWMAPQKVETPLFHQPAKSKIVSEPLGAALIIAPWNYPFQLLIAPLVASIAAGNTAVLKPSEIAENTSKCVASLILKTFPEEYISVVEGGVEQTTELLRQKWDVIFYTGNTMVGKIVMKAASNHLTPVILELGGKSPCIVDQHTNIKQTARKVAWGKFMNAGQTCIAPDYVMVHQSIKEEFVKALISVIEDFYGKKAIESDHYARIINQRHFQRLTKYLEGANVVYGGQLEAKECFISPTIIDQPDLNSPLMSEEIFGPLLPIIAFNELEEAISYINDHPKPLALYVFSKKRKTVDQIIARTSSGGVCVNDTISHITTSELPFGGVGDSGMGQYHGRKGFESFSHLKSVMVKSQLFDLPMRYPPYIKLGKGLLKIFKWIN